MTLTGRIAAVRGTGVPMGRAVIARLLTGGMLPVSGSLRPHL